MTNFKNMNNSWTLMINTLMIWNKPYWCRPSHLSSNQGPMSVWRCLRLCHAKFFIINHSAPTSHSNPEPMHRQYLLFLLPNSQSFHLPSMNMISTLIPQTATQSCPTNMISWKVMSQFIKWILKCTNWTLPSSTFTYLQEIFHITVSLDCGTWHEWRHG